MFPNRIKKTGMPAPDSKDPSTPIVIKTASITSA